MSTPPLENLVKYITVSKKLKSIQLQHAFSAKLMIEPKSQAKSTESQTKAHHKTRFAKREQLTPSGTFYLPKKGSLRSTYMTYMPQLPKNIHHLLMTHTAQLLRNSS